ncbi:MAG TPA: hypothetical protein VF158_15150 [Longimicrobiales bacterium]
MNAAFEAAWRRAFAERRPEGLAFHGFCRAAVTAIADSLGVEEAVDSTDRSIATVVDYGKEVQQEERLAVAAFQMAVAASLEQTRRGGGYDAPRIATNTETIPGRRS